MSLITINSKADLEEAFQTGRQEGKREALETLSLFIIKEAQRFKEINDSSLYSKGVYDAYKSILNEMKRIIE